MASKRDAALGRYAHAGLAAQTLDQLDHALNARPALPEAGSRSQVGRRGSPRPCRPAFPGRTGMSVGGMSALFTVTPSSTDCRDLDLDEVHARRADEAGDEQVGRAVIELKRAADLLDDSRLEHDDPIAERHRFDLVVGDVDDGAAKLAVQFDEFGPHGDAQRRVEIGQRLVEQEDAHVAHDRAAQRDALALSARELGRPAIQEFADMERRGRGLRPSPRSRPSACAPFRARTTDSARTVMWG